MKRIIDIDEKWYLNIIASKDLIDKDDEAYLILNSKPYEERPQGEWEDHSDEGYVECPFCHEATNCDDNKKELHFCWNCGADMRGYKNESSN